MRMKKIFRYEITLWLLAPFTLVIPCFYFLALAEMRWERSLEFARQNSVDLVHEHWIPPEIPDEENASVKLDEIAAAIKDQFDPPAHPEGSAGMVIQNILDQPKLNTLLTASEMHDLATAVESYPEIIQRLLEALQLNKARKNLNYDDVVHIQNSFSPDRHFLSCFLHAQAIAHMQNGKYQDAVHCIAALLKLSRLSIQEYPNILTWLFGRKISVQACLALHLLEQHYAISFAERTVLIAEIKSFLDEDLLSKSMVCEIFPIMKEMEGTQFFKTLQTYLSLDIPNPYVLAEKSAVLDGYIKIIQRMREQEYTYTTVENQPGWSLMSRIVLPNFAHCLPQGGINQTYLRMALLSLILQDYKESHGGYPESLDALQENVDADSLLDSFSKEPWVFNREASGYTLYGLGPDNLDNQGEMKENFWLPTYKGDLVWFVKDDQSNEQ